MVNEWIVVTGASAGLGEAISERILTESNYGVIGISRRAVNERLVEKYPNRVFSLEFDLTRVAEIPKLVAEIVKNYRVFGLINNAALGANSILATQHESEIQALINCNLGAPILLAKYLSRSMIRNRAGGRIINVASVVGHTGYNGLAAYGATKAGLIGFTKSLARELGRAKISVNSISPGFMETDMTSSLGDHMETIRRRSPVKQFPKLSDVTEVVMLLLLAEHTRFTGHDYIVDAGNSC